MANVMLSNVIRRAQTKVDKDNTDLIFYVGGEHIVSENIRVHSRGIIAESTIGPMFYYGFKAGDFLLVSRNPHLKKAGLVDFDGICSEKTFVLETADSDVLLPEFLPFVLQNERFWDYAYRHRHGSTNTFINWSTLANYEFELPDLETQRKLAEVLWSINDTMDAYKKLISATDELVKSQFMEQFVIEAPYERTRLGDHISQIRGVSYKPADLRPSLSEESVLLLRANNIGTGRINHDEVQYVAKEKVSTVQLIRAGDILMCASSGSLEHVGKAAICLPSIEGETFGAFCKLIRPKGDLLPEYIAAYFETDEYREIIMQLACGSNINNLKAEHIDELQIPTPPAEVQEAFVSFLRQSDKSKFAALQCCSQSIMPHNDKLYDFLGTYHGSMAIACMLL